MFGPDDEVIPLPDATVEYIVAVPLHHRGHDDLLRVTVTGLPTTPPAAIQAAVLVQVQRSCAASWGPGRLVPHESGRYRWE